MQLRPYTEHDRDLTVALESDPEVVGHLGGVRDEPDAVRVHENRMAAIADGDLFYTIMTDDGTDRLGIVAIWRSEWASRPIHELGGMLRPQYQARGLAGHVFELIMPRAVEAGISELHAFPAITNRPSNAFLRKLRFRWVEDCDLEYEGRPLRCAHWIRDLRDDPPSTVP